MADLLTVMKQEQLSLNADGVTTTSVTPPARATAMLLSARTNDAIISLDGTAPSATHGHVIPKALAPLFVQSRPAPGQSLIALAASASAGKLDVTWLG